MICSERRMRFETECVMAIHMSAKVVDLYSHIKHYVNSLWQGLWNSYPDYKLYKIHPTINVIPAKHSLVRKDQVIINRLLIGHSRLTHVHLLTRDPPPTCNNCTHPLTIQHILTDCSKCQHIRQKYYSYSNLKKIFKIPQGHL